MDRQQMYKIKTVAELDSWAHRLGLSIDNDTQLSLLRLQLLADEVTKDLPPSCDVCQARFKQKSHLLRHKRTTHSNIRHVTCPFCLKEFKRQDNLRRHMQQHVENVPPVCTTSRHEEQQTQKQPQKRQASESEEGTDMKEVKTAGNSCNWCSKVKVLLPGKKFCESCGEQGRECRWCHRPLPERFYGRRADICDGCVTRRENWKHRHQYGAGRTTALDNTAQSVTIEPSSANLWDILQFFKDNEDSVSDILTNRLEHIKGIKWFMILFVKFVKYNENTDAVYAEPVFRSSSFAMTNVSQTEEQISEAFQNVHVHNSYQNFERDGSGWTIDKILKLEVDIAEYAPLEGSSYIPLPKKIRDKKAVLNIKNDDQKCFMWSVLAAIHPVDDSDHPARASHYATHEEEMNLSGLDFPMPMSQICKFEKQNNISVNVFGLEGNEVYPLQITSYRNMSQHVNLLLFSKGEIRHYCLIRNLSRLLSNRTLHDGQTYYCNYCLHGFTTVDLLNEHIPYCSQYGPQKLSLPKSEDKQWVQFNTIHKQLKVPFVIYADLESFIKPISSCNTDPDKPSTTPYQKHEPCGFSFMVKCTNDELSKPAEVYRGANVIDTIYKRLLQEEQYICDILGQVKPMKLTPAQEQSFQEANDCHICEKVLGADRVRDHCHLSGVFRGAAHSHCNLQYQFRQGKRSQTSKFYIPVIFHNLCGYDFPYDFLTCSEKFEQHELPSIEHFYNKLNETDISDDDYRHAQTIWRTFNMHTFGEYHDLYLLTDVLLLADVFENFRSLCLDYYHLDAAHYYTAPGIAWDSMLKKTDVKLQLLDDIDMVLMIERGLFLLPEYSYLKQETVTD